LTFVHREYLVLKDLVSVFFTMSLDVAVMIARVSVYAVDWFGIAS
jgi:hypothetical protein